MGRLLIIGLDGATFDLIKPWAQAGKLPHLATLLENGVHGALKSTIPPMSPPAWTSFMTGKNPGKHAIFDFTVRRPHSYEVEFISARCRKAETIWKIMSDAGKRLCVLSVPITYPPEKINGIMISGLDTPGIRGVADPSAMHPPEVHAEITEKLGGYLISPNLNAFDSHQCDEMVEAALTTVQRKMESALYFFAKEPWDCFMITVGETDGIAHRLWHYHDKSSPLSDEHSRQYMGEDPLLRIYQKIDAYIGQFRRLLSDDTTLLIMSDHGQGVNGNKVIYLNKWLEEQGLLQFKTHANNYMPAAAIRIAKRIGLKVLPSSFKKMIFRRTQLANKVESSWRFAHIDWDHTQAYSEETPYYPSIWINMRGREPQGIVRREQEYDEVRERIIRELSTWHDPETGQPVVHRVYKREEVYSGPFVEQLPDLCIEWNLDGKYSYLFKNSREMRGRQASITRLDPKEYAQAKSGDHRDYGIFIAFGAHLQRQREITGAEIIDLAPTMLHLLGLQVPTEMDGKVLIQLFDDSFASQPVRYCQRPEGEAVLAESQPGFSTAEEEALRERLKGLGYLD